MIRWKSLFFYFLRLRYWLYLNYSQIASIFYYLCVVTLQYIAPILMCLYFALMYKTLGGYNWSDLFANNTANGTCAVPPTEAPVTTPLDDGFSEFTEEQATLDKSILESAKELQSSFHGLKAVISNLFYFFSSWRFLFNRNSVSWNSKLAHNFYFG